MESEEGYRTQEPRRLEELSGEEKQRKQHNERHSRDKKIKDNDSKLRQKHERRRKEIHTCNKGG